MKSIHRPLNLLLNAGSYAVTHMPNCCMVRILSLFTILKVPGRQIEKNLSANERVLAAAVREKAGFFTAGRFIENQNEWESVRFGLSTMKYSGCEIMAVYNALLDLGNRMTAQDMAELISAFETRGAELQGRWGCSPGSVRNYLIRRGYRVITTAKADPDTINSIGENSDSVIITAYNDRNDIRRMIHTISVTKDTGGHYTLHNAYKRINGRYAAYSGSTSVNRLWEVMGLISQGQAAPIYVIGISQLR